MEMKQTHRLLIICCALFACTGAVIQTATAEVHRNMQYGKVGDVALHVDLYLPEKHEAPTPLIVWVHGGAWRQGSKDWCPFTWMSPVCAVGT